MFSRNTLKSVCGKALLAISVFSLAFSSPLNVIDSYADHKQDMEYNQTLPIKSNSIENWPVGPALSCYSAILMDAETGVILYEKNSYEKMFPASTTKLMTCLLAVESETAQLNDMVPFSYDAVMSIPWDGSNMGMNVGDKMTLEDCLYGVLVVSANEVANAVGEYVGGDQATFVNMMNTRAKELGCVNTHFNNPHGYSDPDHYTCAYDLARIGRAFFSNELLVKISSTRTYHWYPTEYQPDDIVLTSNNYFSRGRIECEGFIGSKTGYTGESRQVLVTCAERNGMKLIAVVMKEETPYQYNDTVTLLDYGFANFEKVKASDYEKKYSVTDENFFHSNISVFGDSSSLFTIDSSSVIVPKNASFEDLTTSLTFNDDVNSNEIATIRYEYNGAYVGKANILYKKSNNSSFTFNMTEPKIEYEDFVEEDIEEEPQYIYINYIIYGVIALLLLIFLISIIAKVFSSYHFSERRKASRRWKKRKSYGPDYTKTTKKPSKKKDSIYKDLY